MEIKNWPLISYFVATVCLTIAILIVAIEGTEAWSIALMVIFLLVAFVVMCFAWVETV